MKNDLAILVRVLAATDAIWLPLRSGEWRQKHASAAVWAARTNYRRYGGIILPMPGTALERKRSQLAMDRLIRDRYLVVTTSRGRGHYLRLTDATEDRLRRRCGLPGLGLSFQTAATLSDRWTPEVNFSNGHGWGDGRVSELLHVEHLMLPSLIRGYVESNSDIHGHAYYRRVKDPPKDWPESLFDEVLDAELEEYYFTELMVARNQVMMTAVSPLEVGIIPLPGAMGDAAEPIKESTNESGTRTSEFGVATRPSSA